MNFGKKKHQFFLLFAVTAKMKMKKYLKKEIKVLKIICLIENI